MSTLKKKYKQIRSRRAKKYKFKGGNKSSIPIIIYSHSDVFDVLKIQLEYFSKLFSNTTQDIYLFSNTPYPPDTSTDIKLKYKTILYDDNNPYFTRLLSCIRQIDSPYFIITHENDILLKFDKDIINKLVNQMEENKIDSINLQHKDNYTKLVNETEDKYKPEIKISETLYISKMTDDRFTFCVQPRIWKKESAINLFSALPHKPYFVSSENHDVQSYVLKNQITYIIYSINSIGKHTTLPEYSFLHITIGGKFMSCKKNDNLDEYAQTEFNNICNKYIKNGKRNQMP
jgi:hypothetical protein